MKQVKFLHGAKRLGGKQPCWRAKIGRQNGFLTVANRRLSRAIFIKTYPRPYSVRVFDVKDDVRSARLYIAGLGYYEASLNGTRVGDHRLDPGWTNYAKEVLYSTYDVTRQLKKGRNCIGVLLGNGFYNPIPMPIFRNLRQYLTIGQPCLKAQLRIEYANGEIETILSDTNWTYAQSPILRNNVYLG